MMKACGGTAAKWKRRYAMRLTVPGRLVPQRR
jgi:hypothetical protein